jgi:hypothetical protein
VSLTCRRVGLLNFVIHDVGQALCFFLLCEMSMKSFAELNYYKDSPVYSYFLMYLSINLLFLLDHYVVKTCFVYNLHFL